MVGICFFVVITRSSRFEFTRASIRLIDFSFGMKIKILVCVVFFCFKFLICMCNLCDIFCIVFCVCCVFDNLRVVIVVGIFCVRTFAISRTRMV